jgi:hypothetical protein
VVFEDAGHAILRTRGEAGLTAALTFGPYGGFHGHLDKLSFVLCGFSEELGVDPGRARSQAYRLPIHSRWYKATLAHNSVLVDGQSQKPAAGKLLQFESGDDYALAAASCAEAYPGVSHTRWLVLTPTHLLGIDRLQSEKEHRFDWLYHNQGRAVTCTVARGPCGPAALGRSPACNWLPPPCPASGHWPVDAPAGQDRSDGPDGRPCSYRKMQNNVQSARIVLAIPNVSYIIRTVGNTKQQPL